MTRPCCLTGAPSRVSEKAWAYIPAGSIVLHQAIGRVWPADLEFPTHEARDRWEAVQRNIETLAEFPELAQRMAFRQAHPDDAESAMSRLILDQLRADLARVKDELPEGMREAEARAWDRAARSIDEALRRVKWGKK